ncbi:MAG: glycosyltransferase family 9 protein, partial [Oceanidesulfovibrio sp.]
GSWRGGAGEALLFPGAGHRAKEWPAGHWRKLATLLPSHGIACRFALGPAELERGFDGQGVPTVTPESLDELASLVADASVVVCADTGPMHLAALSGTPALALFGPTSAGQWAPVGVCVLRAGVDCRPCSRTTRNIPCAAPECMATITVDEAARHVRTLLEGDKKKKPA